MRTLCLGWVTLAILFAGTTWAQSPAAQSRGTQTRGSQARSGQRGPAPQATRGRLLDPRGAAGRADSGRGNRFGQLRGKQRADLAKQNRRGEPAARGVNQRPTLPRLDRGEQAFQERLAGVDRMRDQAIATDNVELLAQADVLEQQMRQDFAKSRGNAVLPDGTTVPYGQLISEQARLQGRAFGQFTAEQARTLGKEFGQANATKTRLLQPPPPQDPVDPTEPVVLPVEPTVEAPVAPTASEPTAPTTPTAETSPTTEPTPTAPSSGS